MPTTDQIVAAGEFVIAVRDYGGTGSPVLLLHGAGANLAAWDEVGPLLAAHHRAVAVDLRGHGESDDGPWSWDAVVTDLDAVVRELALDRPAAVGHSLGGGLAAWWAYRHPECPAVVDLDGHRSPVTSPERHVPAAAGLSEAGLRRDVARLAALFDEQAEAMASPLTDEQVDAMLATQRTVAKQYDVEPERWAAMVRRGLVRRDGALTAGTSPAEPTRQLGVDLLRRQRMGAAVSADPWSGTSMLFCVAGRAQHRHYLPSLGDSQGLTSFHLRQVTAGVVAQLPDPDCRHTMRPGPARQAALGRSVSS